MIVVDLHEPDELKQIADEIKDLGFDYLITGSERTYIIERKTLVDLVGSIRSRDSKVKDRLFEQLLRIKSIENEMRADGKEAYAILVVEGNHFKRYNARFAKMTPQQWMGIQAKVVEMGIGMIRTWTINETKVLIEILDKRAGKEGKQIVDIGFRKELRTIEEEAMHMIMAISGVGEKKARILFNEFGNVKNIVNAEREKLIRLVGDKLGRHIYDVVNVEVR